MKAATLSLERCRDLDRRAREEYGIPTLLLMEGAGRALADLIERSLIPPISMCRVVVVAGSGNNGGDGFAAARHLYQRGISTHVFLAGTADETRDDARVNFRIISALGVSCEPLSQLLERRRDWDRCPVVVVDAVVGTGFHPPTQGPVAAAIQAVNNFKETHTSSTKIIAADIPSGLDGDAGPVGGPVVRADVTIAFACLKPGLVKPESRPYVGRLEVADIGIPAALLKNEIQ